MTIHENISDIANRSKSSLAEVTDLYAKISLNAERLKISEKDCLKLTENIATSLSLSGASNLDREGVILAIGQGLGGIFQIDELVRLIDANPVVIQALLKEFAIETVKTVQELKKLALEGELTAERVVKAFLEIETN